MNVSEAFEQGIRAFCKQARYSEEEAGLMVGLAKTGMPQLEVIPPALSFFRRSPRQPIAARKVTPAAARLTRGLYGLTPAAAPGVALAERSPGSRTEKRKEAADQGAAHPGPPAAKATQKRIPPAHIGIEEYRRRTAAAKATQKGIPPALRISRVSTGGTSRFRVQGKEYLARRAVIQATQRYLKPYLIPPTVKGEFPTLDMGKWKERVYGKGFEAQVRMADQYNKAQKLPFRMSNYLTYKPFFRQGERSMFSLTGSPYSWVAPGRKNKGTIFLGREPGGSVGRQLLAATPTMRKRLEAALARSGLTPNYQPSVGGTISHEMTHAVESRTPKAAPWLLKNYALPASEEIIRARTRKSQGSKVAPLSEEEARAEKITYPEASASEVLPPLTALQEHVWKTRGKRITSPEEFEQFVAPYTQLSGATFEAAIEDLPVEVKRLLRYRQRLQGKPRRLKLMDSIMKKLIPGIVKLRMPSVQRI